MYKPKRTKNMKNQNSRKIFCALLLILGISVNLSAQDNLPFSAADIRDLGKTTFLYYVTGNNEDNCWGGEDSVYTDDSPFSVAAVHAGLLKVNQTGLVKVTLLPGRDSYPSVTRNGITSESAGEMEGSYKLSAPEPDDVADAFCNMADYIGKYNIVFVFRVKADKEGPFWGGKNNIYTHDSYIAPAAVHAGVLKPGETGIVKIKMLPDQGSYPTITRNGLTSNEFGSEEGSYQFIKDTTP